ncbi:hypothetical protein F5141DRAFT_19801 [Pisolithus sp. B1]|nr:hypothetical protein F5141DRAFT_19801 [Pisolithus sp. B1]
MTLLWFGFVAASRQYPIILLSVVVVLPPTNVRNQPLKLTNRRHIDPTDIRMAPPGTNANPSITFDLHGHYQVELQQDPRGSRSQSRGPNTVTCVMKSEAFEVLPALVQGKSYTLSRLLDGLARSKDERTLEWRLPFSEPFTAMSHS